MGGMAIERFPSELKIGRQDFLLSDWREVVNKCPKQDYYSLHSQLAIAAKAAMEDGQSAKGVPAPVDWT